MSIREERIKKSIEKEVMNLIVNGSIKDPRVPNLLTITKVTLSKDKHYSHIYITLTGTEQAKELAVKGLNNAKGFIQLNLADKLQLRYTPKIEFRLDKFEDKAELVDELLKQISDELHNGAIKSDE
ncbi:MAG: ribosome-binding factor A [Spirochaetes bacterium GWF1_31_7]|nr:MAG: ribosome-binding factor A [Spirochaetes bacterium GWE1_32_154]OHD44871.1 MAG: ribosome-binding factor A [Spirochaetes bacterium GWE2_31_10]OHD47662.1 MAG: ribosome-binding factor A [Spirochaetes bacterium GWF1_31_7]HBD94439.1 30S ribosome-binding factor RbfA [Spirochaetia bacterium]HBI37685.1 30S ribosome-binding factor RbfA [Spirochaetia bacterium]